MQFDKKDQVVPAPDALHHAALQYFIPGCKPAFEEIMRLIRSCFVKKRKENTR